MSAVKPRAGTRREMTDTHYASKENRVWRMANPHGKDFYPVCRLVRFVVRIDGSIKPRATSALSEVTCPECLRRVRVTKGQEKGRGVR